MATEQTESLQAETKPFYQQQSFWLLVLLFVGAFVLRLLLTNVFEGHPTDVRNFKAWSMHAATHPFYEFYESVTGKGNGGVWADYPPLYILVLWFVGKFYLLFSNDFSHWQGPLFTSLIKLPSILADLGCMAFFILILKRYVHFSLACFAAFIFALHPAAIYESAMWGQIDSVTLLLQLAAIWFVLRKQEAAAIVMTVLNILVKPQGLILMPLILFITLYRKQWIQLFAGLASSALVTFVVTAIFVPIAQIPSWLMAQYTSQSNLYSYSTIQAFNIWAFGGMWNSDVSRGIFGWGGTNPALILQHKTWGLILFSCAYLFALGYYVWKARAGEEDLAIWHMSAFIMIAFFLLPTRMHERYLYSGLFLLLGSFILQRRLLWPFVLLSGTFMLNLLFELPGHKTELGFPNIFYRWNTFLVPLEKVKEADGWFPYEGIAILNLLLFAVILYLLCRYALKDPSARLLSFIQRFKLSDETEQKVVSDKPRWIPAPIGLDKKDVWILAAILFGTAIIKLWRLGFPPEMVFDEVYHARAAGEFLIAVKPLEWVHPPLAKLLIAIGVSFYELTGVGWRVVPVIAGTLLLFSVYCLGRFSLPHRWQAVLATLMLACDGVYFVQSRTAMTNIFATLFQVTALMLTWRFIQMYWHRPRQNRNYVYFIWAIIFIGLALSTRWTSLYSYGFIIGVLGFGILVPSTINLSALWQGRVQWTLSVRTLMQWLLIPGLTVLIPFVIYLIAYIPYYLNYNYDVAKVLLEQKGMWDYHSHLTDPHPYYSAWYTWPWLTRPTWYYFHSFGKEIGGIIALGNPAIWWFSMPTVAVLLVLASLNKRLNYFYLGVACLFMYLPWGLSPRTLNYSHYFFEAVPYACLSSAAVMGALVHRFQKTGWAISYAYFGIVCALFLFFYPIYGALPISWQHYGLMRWFPSWV